MITLYLWKNDRELLKLYSSVIKSVIACYLRSGKCPSLLRQKRHKGCITFEESAFYFPPTLSRELLIFPLKLDFWIFG